MPIDNVTWTNCRKCGHRYGTHISRCPRCNAKTTLISTKVIAVIAVVAIVAAAGSIYLLNPFNLQLPSLSKPQAVDDNSAPIVEENGTTEGAGESTPVVETPQESSKTMVTETLLHKEIPFIGKQTGEFNVNIPENNDGYLHSIITPDLNSSVGIEIYKNDKPYCDGSVCFFTIKGQGGASPDTYQYMDIPVDSGDKVSFVVHSNPVGYSQVVEVLLFTKYEKQETVSPNEIVNAAETSAGNPINTFTTCQIELMGWNPDRLIVFYCDYKDLAASGLSFNTPPAIKNYILDRVDKAGTTGIEEYWKVKIYQYGNNDFSIVATDNVSEKRYDHVTLWELPT